MLVELVSWQCRFISFAVIDPAVIQDQMDFSRFVMLKMFLTAVSTGNELSKYNNTSSLAAQS